MGDPRIWFIHQDWKPGEEDEGGKEFRDGSGGASERRFLRLPKRSRETKGFERGFPASRPLVDRFNGGGGHLF